MSTDLPERRLLRPTEVAAFFAVSARTIYQWYDEGKLDGVKPSGKVLRIFRESVVALASQKENA